MGVRRGAVLCFGRGAGSSLLWNVPVYRFSSCPVLVVLRWLCPGISRWAVGCLLEEVVAEDGGYAGYRGSLSLDSGRGIDCNGSRIPIFSGKRVLRVVILGTRLAGGRLRQLALQDGLEQAAAGGIDSFFVACCGVALLRNIVPAWLQGLHHLGDHRAGRSTPHDLWCATNDKKETRCDSSKR